MANYAKINIGNEGRMELHVKLALTGAEVSVNQLPAGEGSAVFVGVAIPLTAGDWLRVAPAAKRQFSASAHSGITYVCIQVRENSLEAFTAGDAIMC